MTKLSKKNQDLIRLGVSTCGLCEDAYYYIEENLFISQANSIHKFILWLEKKVGGVGKKNIDQLWYCYKHPNCEKSQKKLKEIQNRIALINSY